MNQSKNILIYFLNYLHKKNIPLDEFVIQKGIYLLKEMGLPMKFYFKSYIYGPYSIDLALELDEMVFWGELAQVGSRYTIEKIEMPIFSKSMKEKIDNKLNCLEKALDKKFDFNNLELVSITVCAIRALEAVKEKINKTSVIKEIQSWKGKKVFRKEIVSVYDRIREIFLWKTH